MSEENTNKKYEVVYESGGQEVKLNPSIVHQFITKGNAQISLQEAVNFMQLCKYSGLNPFLNEAYLIKYANDKPADMVVAKEALMKRANRQENFKGFKAGVIVENTDNEVIYKNGQFVATKEKLVGGWAKVFRSDLEFPFEVEVGLDEYNTYKSTWKKMPANMIRKVALANALREAFPEVLSSMKTDDEPNDSDHASGFQKEIEEPKAQPELLGNFNKEELAEQAKKKMEEKKAAEEAAAQAEKEAEEKAVEAKKKEEEEKKAAAEEQKKKKAEEKKAAAEKKKAEAAAKKKAEADKKKEEESKTTDDKKGVNEEVEHVETETVDGVETTTYSDDKVIDVEFEEVEGEEYDREAEQESLFKGLGFEPNEQ